MFALTICISGFAPFTFALPCLAVSFVRLHFCVVELSKSFYFRVSIQYLLFSSFWSSLLHSLLVFRQHCSLFFLYWQWISLKYTVFIVLSVVYIWGVISYNTLLSKSVQIKFRMFIIHTNFLSFLQIMMILIFYLLF